jgi:hypothetical protein
MQNKNIYIPYIISLNWLVDLFTELEIGMMSNF